MANHLWQSTLFAALAALFTVGLRNNRASVRYWLWLGASVKFLVPFSVLVSLGSLVDLRRAPSVQAPQVAFVVEQISQPFSVPRVDVASESSRLPLLVPILWLCGSTAVLLIWARRWKRARAALLDSSPLGLDAAIAVRSSRSLIEPGVFGLFRPVLLLPEGIVDRLTPAQFQAILAHEMSHVRRRDNLWALVPLVVEAVFWFHPLVWWIGARLVEERERACDEEVLGRGSDPQVYAEGILRVCEFYLASPMEFVAGVTGSDLKRRIEGIMTNRIVHALGAWKRLLLAAAGVAAVVLPIASGALNGSSAQAQSLVPLLTQATPPAPPRPARQPVAPVPPIPPTAPRSPAPLAPLAPLAPPEPPAPPEPGQAILTVGDDASVLDELVRDINRLRGELESSLTPKQKALEKTQAELKAREVEIQAAQVQMRAMELSMKQAEAQLQGQQARIQAMEFELRARAAQLRGLMRDGASARPPQPPAAPAPGASPAPPAPPPAPAPPIN